MPVSKDKIRSVLISMAELPNAPAPSNITALINEYHAVLGQWDEYTLDAGVLHYKSTGTFFPSPGKINEKILELHTIALQIPTGAEAWADVLSAERAPGITLCQKGQDLKEAAENGEAEGYAARVDLYGDHIDSCEICLSGKSGGFRYIYKHPIVEATVKILGGRERLFTDNAAADRKQFIDAYNQRVSIESNKSIMPPQVRDFIQAKQTQALEAGSMIGRLASGLSK